MAEQSRIQQVTMKDPKKVEARKRLADYNCMKREERARLAKAQSESNIMLLLTNCEVHTRKYLGCMQF